MIFETVELRETSHVDNIAPLILVRIGKRLGSDMCGETDQRSVFVEKDEDGKGENQSYL